jgi:hypothetical protein
MGDEMSSVEVARTLREHGEMLVEIRDLARATNGRVTQAEQAISELEEWKTTTAEKFAELRGAVRAMGAVPVALGAGGALAAIIAVVIAIVH